MLFNSDWEGLGCVEATCKDGSHLDIWVRRDHEEVVLERVFPSKRIETCVVSPPGALSIERWVAGVRRVWQDLTEAHFASWDDIYRRKRQPAA
jgi:hypothetical protein